ncbi:Hypothetical predicted protein [Paramuricea clavata]|uniref:Uncharacterized protein n=1 Tax=Paramuricea clavata TaxID=317549 RepID=A0A6S7I0D4_PARCT|nr:Hypothetical predicted protein [Paramuricea clavata]
MSRPCSLQLLLEDLPAEATADGPASLRVVIFNSLMDTGIDRALIEGIECLSKKLWFIVFKEQLQRQKYINKDIELHSKPIPDNLKCAEIALKPATSRKTAKQARSVECVVTRVTVKVIAQRNDATFARRKAMIKVNCEKYAENFHSLTESTEDAQEKNDQAQQVRDNDGQPGQKRRLE